MIRTKQDYEYYIKRDQLARGIRTDRFSDKLKHLVYMDPTWKFQKRLRKTEYFFNKKKNFIELLYYYYLEYKFKKISIRLGFSIPKNVFGPGLAIPHYGTIIVNSRARVGANCRIHCDVNIGASGGKPEAPVLGDNVYIGPGAKIYGNIKIAKNVAIAANACVNKSFDEENIIIGGIPAKKINSFDVRTVIKHL